MLNAQSKKSNSNLHSTENEQNFEVPLRLPSIDTDLATVLSINQILLKSVSNLSPQLKKEIKQALSDEICELSKRKPQSEESQSEIDTLIRALSNIYQEIKESMSKFMQVPKSYSHQDLIRIFADFRCDFCGNRASVQKAIAKMTFHQNANETEKDYPEDSFNNRRGEPSLNLLSLNSSLQEVESKQDLSKNDKLRLSKTGKDNQEGESKSNYFSTTQDNLVLRSLFSQSIQPDEKFSIRNQTFVNEHSINSITRKLTKINDTCSSHPFFENTRFPNLNQKKSDEKKRSESLNSRSNSLDNSNSKYYLRKQSADPVIKIPETNRRLITGFDSIENASGFQLENSEMQNSNNFDSLSEINLKKIFSKKMGNFKGAQNSVILEESVSKEKQSSLKKIKELNEKDSDCSYQLSPYDPFGLNSNKGNFNKSGVVNNTGNEFKRNHDSIKSLARDIETSFKNDELLLDSINDSFKNAIDNTFDNEKSSSLSIIGRLNSRTLVPHKIEVNTRPDNQENAAKNMKMDLNTKEFQKDQVIQNLALKFSFVEETNKPFIDNNTFEQTKDFHVQNSKFEAIKRTQQQSKFDGQKIPLKNLELEQEVKNGNQMIDSFLSPKNNVELIPRLTSFKENQLINNRNAEKQRNLLLDSNTNELPKRFMTQTENNITFKNFEDNQISGENNSSRSRGKEHQNTPIFSKVHSRLIANEFEKAIVVKKHVDEKKAITANNQLLAFTKKSPKVAIESNGSSSHFFPSQKMKEFSMTMPYISQPGQVEQHKLDINIETDIRFFESKRESKDDLDIMQEKEVGSLLRNDKSQNLNQIDWHRNTQMQKRTFDKNVGFIRTGAQNCSSPMARSFLNPKPKGTGCKDNQLHSALSNPSFVKADLVNLQTDGFQKQLLSRNTIGYPQNQNFHPNSVKGKGSPVNSHLLSNNYAQKGETLHNNLKLTIDLDELKRFSSNPKTDNQKLRLQDTQRLRDDDAKDAQKGTPICNKSKNDFGYKVMREKAKMNKLEKQKYIFKK